MAQEELSPSVPPFCPFNSNHLGLQPLGEISSGKLAKGRCLFFKATAAPRVSFKHQTGEDRRQALLERLELSCHLRREQANLFRGQGVDWLPSRVPSSSGTLGLWDSKARTLDNPQAQISCPASSWGCLQGQDIGILPIPG